MRFGSVLFGLVNDTEASVFGFYPLRLTTGKNQTPNPSEPRFIYQNQTMNPPKPSENPEI